MSSSIGVKATIIDENSLEFKQLLGLPDGSEYISEDITADINDFEKNRKKFSSNFIDQGAKDLLDRAEKLTFK